MENTEEKFEGQLVFDVQSGMFWIAKSPTNGIQLKFGDSFEVSTENGWQETSLEIANDENGNLVFKLKNTPYQGELEGLEARK